MTKEDILPGITRLIGELKEHGVKLSIASASKNAPAILEKLGLANEFDAIADPSKVANGKPAPDIFLAGANAVELELEHINILHPDRRHKCKSDQ